MDLASLGWSPFFEEAFKAHDGEGFVPARITGRQGNLYIALAGCGETRGKVSGRLRYECANGASFPVVGDWVAVKANPETGLMTIHALLPRRTKFERADYNGGAYIGDQTVSANVDVIIVVASLDQEVNENRIVRYLAQGSASGAKTILVLNKSDLSEDACEAMNAAMKAARGARIVLTSAVTGAGIPELAELIGPGVTGSMVGPSGSGKSSIINSLLGEGRLKTGGVRGGDFKGRHTTTWRELVILPSGGMLIDNPGMRSIGVTGDEGLVAAAFEDVESLIALCKFRDCQHRTEPGCAVKAAIADGHLAEERFENYKRLQRELWIISVKKSQRSRQGAALSKAIKRRQKAEKLVL
ncbi:MAG: ribosome small subunit-dependent GTPase A [Methanobacteriota archaeon]